MRRAWAICTSGASSGGRTGGALVVGIDGIAAGIGSVIGLAAANVTGGAAGVGAEASSVGATGSTIAGAGARAGAAGVDRAGVRGVVLEVADVPERAPFDATPRSSIGAGGTAESRTRPKKVESCVRQSSRGCARGVLRGCFGVADCDRCS